MGLIQKTIKKLPKNLKCLITCYRTILFINLILCFIVIICIKKDEVNEIIIFYSECNIDNEKCRTLNNIRKNDKNYLKYRGLYYAFNNLDIIFIIFGIIFIKIINKLQIFFIILKFFLDFFSIVIKSLFILKLLEFDEIIEYNNNINKIKEESYYNINLYITNGFSFINIFIYLYIYYRINSNRELRKHSLNIN